MRLPRDMSGQELATRLARLQYSVTRQTGSHIRLSRSVAPQHHVTVPDHDNLRVGTLNNILKDIAEHLRLSKDEVIGILLGE